MLAKLMTEKTMDRGGYEKAGGTKDVSQMNAYEKDRQARSATSAQPGGGNDEMTEEQALQRAIRKSPEDVNGYLKLGDYYKRKKKLDEAHEAFKKGLEVAGGDPNVQEQLEDIELDLMRREVGKAKDDYAQNRDSKKIKKVYDDLSVELLKREVTVLNSRIERYPNDMRLKLELAQRYKKTDDWSKAIPLLQQAAGDKRLAADALVALGELFIKDKKNDLSRRQFEKALGLLDPQDQKDLFLTCHYALGRIYEKDGKTDKAEDHYQEVIMLDYEYRDARVRMEKLGEGG